MPFYRETNAELPRTCSVKQTYIPTGAISYPATGTDFDRWTRITSYRSGSPRGNLKNETLLDINVDKYAYFLESARDRKFESALRARGFDLTPMPPDKGHPFNLERFTWLWRGKGRVTRPGFYHWDVDGWAPPRFTAGSVEPSAPISDVDTFAYQSWGRMAPTSVVFDAAQFAGELREGLPSLVPSLLKGKLSFFKDLGSDYLNVEFGWKPFINDLQNAARALLSAQQSVSRPFGPVHRYREVQAPEVSSFIDNELTSIVLGGLPSSLISNAEIVKVFPDYGNPGGFQTFRQDVVTLVEKKSWFEANFFLLPKIGYNPNDFMSRLDSLLNVKLTPAVLWELAPWSWLIDWGLRIGDALQTAERLADDRVHAQYAYGMCHTKVRRVQTARQTTDISPLSAASFYERKERVRANPYGFVVGGFAGLNTWQQSILLALGLTKTRR